MDIIYPVGVGHRILQSIQCKLKKKMSGLKEYHSMYPLHQRIWDLGAVRFGFIRQVYTAHHRICY